LGRPFWRRYSRGIIDWLAINVVLYLALAAQVRACSWQRTCIQSRQTCWFLAVPGLGASCA
jgi:hypothetical protein